MTSTLLVLAAAFQAPAVITAQIESPFRVAEDAIIVDASVNGKRVSLMFDTGYGGHLVINDQINIGPRGGTTRLRDFVGVFEARTVRINSIAMGDLKMEKLDVEAVQAPLSHMSHSYGTHTDGIMGFKVVKDFVIEISFEKKKFVFHPRSLDITKRKPDNQRTFLVKMEPRGYNSIELLSEINGKPVQLALDTGNAFYVTSHKEVMERVGLWDPNKKPVNLTQSFVASGPVDSFYLWVPEAKIFGVPVKNSVWDIIDLPSSSVQDDGTVGYGFLKNFNIVIDFDRRHVWLENWKGKVTDDPKAGPGFRVTESSQGRYEVWKVYSGSPAEEKGVKDKDTLLSVDGKSLSMVRPEQVRQLLEGAEGSTCKLIVSRQGIIHRFDVPRKLMANGAPGK